MSFEDKLRTKMCGLNEKIIGTRLDAKSGVDIMRSYNRVSTILCINPHIYRVRFRFQKQTVSYLFYIKNNRISDPNISCGISPIEPRFSDFRHLTETISFYSVLGNHHITNKGTFSPQFFMPKHRTKTTAFDQMGLMDIYYNNGKTESDIDKLMCNVFDDIDDIITLHQIA